MAFQAFFLSSFSDITVFQPLWKKKYDPAEFAKKGGKSIA